MRMLQDWKLLVMGSDWDVSSELRRKDLIGRV